MFDKIIKIVLLLLLVAILYILITGTITIKTMFGASKIGMGCGLRKSCLLCVRKHLGKAESLFAEVNNGYPDHFGLAIGNMSEAEDESILAFPELSTKIRAYRLRIEKGDTTPGLLEELQHDVNQLLNPTPATPAQ
jgi:hypothetical protein